MEPIPTLVHDQLTKAVDTSKFLLFYVHTLPSTVKRVLNDNVGKYRAEEARSSLPFLFSMAAWCLWCDTELTDI